MTFFWVATPFLSALWIVRLWTQGLATRYPLLLTFLIGEIVLDLSGFAIYRLAGLRSHLYVWFFLVARIATATLFFLVLLQVYQRLVDDYYGFRKLGQMLLYGCLGLATVIVLGSIFLDPSANLRTLSSFWILQERGIYLALTAVSLVLLGFAIFFRLAPSRNVLTLFAVFGLMFASQASMWALRNFWGLGFRNTRTLVSSALIFFCLLMGTALFSKAGESESSMLDHRHPAGGSDEKFTRRIEEINQTLLNVFRL